VRERISARACPAPTRSVGSTALDKGVIDGGSRKKHYPAYPAGKEITMIELVGSYFAVDAARSDATSALPNAPVVDDGRGHLVYVAGRETQGRVRVSTAGVLRRLADRVERQVPAGAVR
jgi:hypothetical protein